MTCIPSLQIHFIYAPLLLTDSRKSFNLVNAMLDVVEVTFEYEKIPIAIP